MKSRNQKLREDKDVRNGRKRDVEGKKKRAFSLGPNVKVKLF